MDTVALPVLAALIENAITVSLHRLNFQTSLAIRAACAGDVVFRYRFFVAEQAEFFKADYFASGPGVKEAAPHGFLLNAKMFGGFSGCQATA